MSKLNFIVILQTLIIAQLIIMGVVNAGTGNTIGMGIRNMSLGGAANLTNPGVYAAKENPAALIRSQKIRLSLAFTDSVLSLKDTNSYRNTPANSGISNDDYKASNADNLQHYNLAFTLPLNSLFAFGVSGMVPSKSLAYIYAFTGNESQYLMYSDRQQSPEIYSALAIKLPAGFSLGAGVFHSMKMDGTVQVAISSTGTNSRMISKLDPVYLPYAGLNYQKEVLPNHTLYLGATYKDKHSSTNQVSIDTYFNTNVSNVTFSTNSKLVLLYDPAVLSFGGGYKYKTVSIHAKFQKNFWSKYEAPVIDLSGEDLTTLLDGAVPVDYGTIRLSDTYSYSVGLELEDLFTFFEIKTDLRFGLELHTSAIPGDAKNLAVIDTRRTAGSFGTGFLIPKVGSVITIPFTFDIGFKYSHLQKKDFQVVESGTVTQSASIGGSITTLMGGISVEF